MKMAFLLVLGMAWPSLQAAESVPLKLLQTVPLPDVKGRFDHFSVDVKGRRLFVAALGNNSLEVIDLAAGKRIQSVGGMSKPTGVLFLPESNQILVANGDDGTVKVLDGATCQIGRTLQNFADADNLRLDPKGNKLAWLGHGDGVLALIDPAASQAVAKVKLAGHPESFQLEKNGRRVFVNVPEARQITVIDREKRAVAASWRMLAFQGNFPMALDEEGHRLFIGCRRPARLVILNTDNGQPISDLEISGDTDDLFFDRKRKRVYVSCGEGFIDVVEHASGENYKRMARIPTAPGARTSFFSPDLDLYCVAVPERGANKAEIRVFQPE